MEAVSHSSRADKFTADRLTNVCLSRVKVQPIKKRQQGGQVCVCVCMCVETDSSTEEIQFVDSFT